MRRGLAKHMVDRLPIIVSGSLAYDEVFFYDGRIKDHLPVERGIPLYLNLRPRGPHRAPGGCGGNVAYTMSLLGAGVSLSSWLGKDGGDYRNQLERRGIDTSAVVTAGGELTTRAILLADSVGDHILFFGEPETPVRLEIPSLRPYRLAVVTAGIPAQSIEFLLACRKIALPCVVDPGKFIMDVPPADLRDAIDGADSLVLNEYEHRLLLDRLAMSAEELSSRVSRLIITRGGKETIVMLGDSEERVPPPAPRMIVDPSGAGDAFLAAYAYARYRGCSAAWCARCGSTAASFALETPGTQDHRFTVDDFRERLAAAYGTPEAALFP